MARRLQDLKVMLRDDEKIIVLYPQNDAFLRGEAVEPFVKGARLGLNNAGRVAIAVGILLLLIMIGIIGYNIRDFQIAPALFLLTFPASILAYGLSAIRSTQALVSVRNESTHVVQGEVFDAVNEAGGIVGSITFMYAFKSPITGKTLEGAVLINAADPNKQRLRVGSSIAILYKEDTLFSQL